MEVVVALVAFLVSLAQKTIYKAKAIKENNNNKKGEHSNIGLGN